MNWKIRAVSPNLGGLLIGSLALLACSPALAQTCACQGQPVGQSDFPLVPASGAEYCLAEDVTVATGLAIDARGRTNWKLGLNGHTLTFAESGAGRWADLTNASGAEVCGGTIRQGVYGQSAGSPMSSAAGAVDLELYDLTVITRGVGSASVWLADTSPSARIHHSTFRISGQDRFSLLSRFGGEFSDNIVEITELRGISNYPRVFEDPSGARFLRNVIGVDSRSQRVNLFTSWGKSNVTVEGNTINWAQSGIDGAGTGRVFIIDAGARNWSIKDNIFRITSTSVSGGDQYLFVLRVDQAATTGTTGGIRIEHNLIDSTAIGGDDGSIQILSASKGTESVQFSSNRIVGKGNFVSMPSGSTSGYSLACNSFEHSGTGRIMTVASGTTHRDWTIAHNRFATSRSDGIAIQQSSSDVDLSLCQNDGLSTSSIAGNLAGVVFVTGTCSIGTNACWQSAGRSGSRPNPPPAISVN